MTTVVQSANSNPKAFWHSINAIWMGQPFGPGDLLQLRFPKQCWGDINRNKTLDESVAGTVL